MASTWLRRAWTATAAAGAAAAVAITPGSAVASGPVRTTPASATPASATPTSATPTSATPASATLARAAASTTPATPPPPVLPANFRGVGRYIVSDLGISVPFSWQGRNGNSQMIAGGPQYRIWFTNLIYGNSLYTVTYKWPRIPLDPHRRCDRVGSFSLRQFNNLLKTARFVGPEILQGATNRYVDHWRVGIVLGQTQPGFALRAPFALGDIYVDQKDPSQWWQGLQFGWPNLYDPQLDEWFTMTTFSHRPGTVTLPPTCPPPSP